LKKQVGFLSLLVVCLLSLLLMAGCGGGKSGSVDTAQKDKFPTKAITIIIPWTAGGGSDTGARILGPYLEEKLKVPVTIVNKPGGNGWIGWTELLQAKPDGYTLAITNSTQLIAGWLDPAMGKKVSLASFDIIANHVIDYETIAVKSDDKRFKTMKELIEYAKKNETTCATTGASSDEVVAMQKMNKLLGTKFIPVHLKGGSDGMVAVMGGHVDVWIGNVSESSVPSKEGSVLALAVMSPERVKYMPNVPTLKEVTGMDLTNWNSRGFAGPAGLDPAVKKTLEEAFNYAINNPEIVKKMDAAGQATVYKNGADALQFLKQEETGMKDVATLLGWQK
jgi:tripartite-type tricarboxylate transporter receptor subunit TctC